ncbi:hypothetical protein [Lactococcus fujiensis]|uniref:hypothetical protein n=1 Tax=Lactococcus fujiensis TaxID=610251 RepID=UPI0006CF3116|nr:hypothetical protein [Lactococcus fujiensis]
MHKLNKRSTKQVLRQLTAAAAIGTMMVAPLAPAVSVLAEGRGTTEIAPTSTNFNFDASTASYQANATRPVGSNFANNFVLKPVSEVTNSIDDEVLLANLTSGSWHFQIQGTSDVLTRAQLNTALNARNAGAVTILASNMQTGEDSETLVIHLNITPLEISADDLEGLEISFEDRVFNGSSDVNTADIRIEGANDNQKLMTLQNSIHATYEQAGVNMVGNEPAEQNITVNSLNTTNLTFGEGVSSASIIEKLNSLGLKGVIKPAEAEEAATMVATSTGSTVTVSMEQTKNDIWNEHTKVIYSLKDANDKEVKSEAVAFTDTYTFEGLTQNSPYTLSATIVETDNFTGDTTIDSKDVETGFHAIDSWFTAHLQGTGDGTPPGGFTNQGGLGTIIGTTGQSRRLEELTLTGIFDGKGGVHHFDVSAHIQGYSQDVQGVVSENGNSITVGTRARSLRMEGISINIPQAARDQGLRVFYRVHLQGTGWSGWFSDGQFAGTRGQSRRMEPSRFMLLIQHQVTHCHLELHLTNKKAEQSSAFY